VIRFLLNDKIISTQLPAGLQLLDLIRYHQNLKGTKIGCREGDCGACTVLVGTLVNGQLRYQSMTSCLLPLANIHGKHVVTVEGLNLDPDDKRAELNLVQAAMASEGATQCGFCTPGFVVSLAGYCLSHYDSYKKAIASIDGNICRCTGYKSIERAAAGIQKILLERENEDPIAFAVRRKIIPPYFATVKNTLASFVNGQLPADDHGPSPPVAGGTDLYVQKPEEMVAEASWFIYDMTALKEIRRNGKKMILGAAVTVTDLCESKDFNNAIPAFANYSKLVSSTPIRNMATLAGNLANASPIGDLTIFFLALDAKVNLSDNEGGRQRQVKLNKFYKGYKELDREAHEIIQSIEFDIPAAADFFHFEKVSKRTHLDIASVNTAICLRMHENIILSASLSAGGVAPVPKYLQQASEYLRGKTLSENLVAEVIAIAETEIKPISDARGSKEYKALLLRQLVRAHFYSLFDKINTAA
jgi:xanthine dehydrogenase small subunit